MVSELTPLPKLDWKLPNPPRRNGNPLRKTLLSNIHCILRRRRGTGTTCLPENPATASSRLRRAIIPKSTPVIGRRIQLRHGIDRAAFVVLGAIVRVIRGESVDPGFCYLVELPTDDVRGFVGGGDVIGKDRAVSNTDYCGCIGLEDRHVVICDVRVSEGFMLVQPSGGAGGRCLTWIRSILAFALIYCSTPCV
jgi:hypothetical protein